MSRNPSFIFEQLQKCIVDDKKYRKMLLDSKQVRPENKIAFEKEINSLKEKYIDPHLFMLEHDWKWFDIGDIEDFLALYSLTKERIPAGKEWLPFSHIIISAEVTNPETKKQFTIYLLAWTESGLLEWSEEECIRIHYASEYGLAKSQVCVMTKLEGFWMDAAESLEQQAEMNCLGAIVISLMKMLECTNVEVKKEEFPKKLQKKRIAKGNMKGFDRHILVVKPSKYLKEDFPDMEKGTHASPRLHFRRGHIRHLQKGVSVWVRDCMVGKADKGFVDKDYKVEMR